MNITLVRIDDRLIHGQVAQFWSKQANAERIIVVSDEVAKDTLRKQLLISVAPAGIKASVIPVDKLARVYRNPKYAETRALVLFTNPADIVRVVEQGVAIKFVNVGMMSFKEGKRQLIHSINVDDQDITAFKKLNELGVKMELQHSITDPKVDLMSKI